MRSIVGSFCLYRSASNAEKWAIPRRNVRRICDAICVGEWVTLNAVAVRNNRAMLTKARGIPNHHANNSDNQLQMERATNADAPATTQGTVNPIREEEQAPTQYRFDQTTHLTAAATSAGHESRTSITNQRPKTAVARRNGSRKTDGPRRGGSADCRGKR